MTTRPREKKSKPVLCLEAVITEGALAPLCGEKEKRTFRKVGLRAATPSDTETQAHLPERSHRRRFQEVQYPAFLLQRGGKRDLLA